MDTENTTPEPSLEESIGLLLNRVPAPVRDFVLNNLQEKTQQLMDKYQLHVDQGGLLERELLLMLLGQEQPTEFVSALEEAGIASQTVQSLVSDINTDIFMKLHEQEISAPTSSIAEAVSAPSPSTQLPTGTAPWPLQPQISTEPQPRAPRPAPIIPAAPAYMPPQPVAPPAPIVTPTPPVPAPSISQFAKEPLFPSAPATTVPPAPTSALPRQTSLNRPAPASVSAPIPAPAPGVSVMHTMAKDMAEAKSGHTPAAVPPMTQPAPAYTPSDTPRTMPTPSFSTLAPSAPAFAQRQPAPIAPARPATPPPPQMNSSENRDALHAVLKEYGVDPYREPPE